jgi:heat shock protein HslJ
MPRLALIGLTLALAPMTSLACTDPLPPTYDEGSSLSVGRMAGLTWVAEVIAGEPVPSGADVWISVTPEGEVTGRAGCNRLAGSADLDAGVAVFGSLATTFMACDEDRMAREQAFLAAMAEVAYFSVTPEGFLYLSREDGSTAVCLGP